MRRRPKILGNLSCGDYPRFVRRDLDPSMPPPQNLPRPNTGSPPWPRRRSARLLSCPRPLRPCHPVRSDGPIGAAMKVSNGILQWSAGLSQMAAFGAPSSLVGLSAEDGFHPISAVRRRRRGRQPRSEAAPRSGDHFRWFSLSRHPRRRSRFRAPRAARRRRGCAARRCRPRAPSSGCGRSATPS